MEVIISSATIAAAVPLLVRIKDQFRAEEEVVFEWTSPSYFRLSLFWDALVFEKGERKTIRIRGKPGYCAVIVQQMRTQLREGNINFLSGRKELISPLLGKNS